MFFQELLANKILIAAVSGWTIAQILKTLIHMFFARQFVAERLVGSGGMPSSHSATVCALTASTGIIYGGNSFEFALAFIFSMVVMYDAMGVRREAGIQAKVLNEMIELFSSMEKGMNPQEKLKEFIGHSPLQVLAGAILGIIIAFVVCSM